MSDFYSFSICACRESPRRWVWGEKGRRCALAWRSHCRETTRRRCDTATIWHGSRLPCWERFSAWRRPRTASSAHARRRTRSAAAWSRGAWSAWADRTPRCSRWWACAAVLGHWQSRRSDLRERNHYMMNVYILKVAWHAGSYTLCESNFLMIVSMNMLCGVLVLFWTLLPLLLLLLLPRLAMLRCSLSLFFFASLLNDILVAFSFLSQCSEPFVAVLCCF